MGGSVPEEKSSFKMLGIDISSKLDWSSHTISTAKTAFKKIGALICSMNFFLLTLYFYKCTIHGHTWNTVVMSRKVPIVAT